jgi:2-amino-4-hydroxy-6-hydroxymethyldihydropteridine diphosphokinase
MSGPRIDAFIALGSNRSFRAERIRRALFLLDGIPGTRVVDVSGLYETEPLYYRPQADFLNCVAVLETALDPFELLAFCRGIERELGRIRTRRYGPREIDLDIIAYGRRIIRTPELTIPHPGAAGRRFVLLPLREIAPYWRHPVLDRGVGELLAALGESGRVVYQGEIG